jgi:hypothetical protein
LQTDFPPTVSNYITNTARLPTVFLKNPLK